MEGLHETQIYFSFIFISGVLLIFNITNSMLEVGFDTNIDVMKAADRRSAYILVSLFGLLGYFVETVLERVVMNSKKEDNE